MKLLTVPTKTDQVCTIIRRAIKRGEYLPGKRFAGVRQLAKQFKVSTLVISRALEILENEKLVRREHGRGVFVKQWTENDIINVYMLFWGLEEYDNNYFEEFAKIAYPPVMPADFSFNLRAVLKKHDGFQHLDNELSRIDNIADIDCAIIGASPFKAAHIDKFKQLHCPFIMLGDVAYDNSDRVEYNQITGDNYKQGQHCLEFMIQQGYKEISLLTLEQDFFFYRQFSRSVKDTASKAGIKVNLLKLPSNVHTDSKLKADIQKEYQQYIAMAPEGFFDVPVIIYGLSGQDIIDALPPTRRVLNLPIIIPEFDSKYLAIFHSEIFKMIKTVVKEPQNYRRELIDVPFIIHDLINRKKYLTKQGKLSEIKFDKS